jgi:hypothetical protein
LGNEGIGRFFGGLHYSGVSKAARVREAVAGDRELGKIVAALESHFKTLTALITLSFQFLGGGRLRKRGITSLLFKA